MSLEVQQRCLQFAGPFVVAQGAPLQFTNNTQIMLAWRISFNPKRFRVVPSGYGFLPSAHTASLEVILVLGKHLPQDTEEVDHLTVEAFPAPNVTPNTAIFRDPQRMWNHYNPQEVLKRKLKIYFNASPRPQQPPAVHLSPPEVVLFKPHHSMDMQPAFRAEQADVPQLPVLDLSRVGSWSVMDVCAWLQALGLAAHCEVFRTNAIAGPALVVLTESALESMGVASPLDRRTITNGVAVLNTTRDAALRVQQALRIEHEANERSKRVDEALLVEQIRHAEHVEAIARQLQTAMLHEREAHGAHQDQLERIVTDLLEQQQQLQQQQQQDGSKKAVLVAAGVPEELVDPITMELMQDPVCTCDGHTYDRGSIGQWLAGHNTSPITGLPLESKALIPNFALRSLLAKYKQQQNLPPAST